MADEVQTIDIAQLLKNSPGAFSRLKVGDLVEGTIIEKGASRITVDLGKNGTGVMYRGEIQNARELVRDLKLGDVAHGKVVSLDNEEGYVELSLSEAGKQKSWDEIKEMYEKGDPITVKVNGCNKGGLTAPLAGLLAFIPISQLANDNYPQVEDGDKDKIIAELTKLIGKDITVKIIDANPRTNKLIVSERDAVQINPEELLKNYQVGQTIEGIVSGIADFGVFVQFTDNPAVEGLVHVSELSYRLVDNPKEMVKVDQVVNAKITEIKDGKIALSMKALEADPWPAIAERYQNGQEVKGTAYSFNQFGAIVNLDATAQGMVHVTEFGGLDEMKKQLSLGKEYNFTIESVNLPQKRITLKLKK